MNKNLDQAIIRANRAAPYWQEALASVAFVEDVRCPTMGVDKFWRCYYNPKFVDSLPIEQLTYVVLHELSHLMFQHHLRCAAISGEQRRWNLAADAEINSLQWNGLVCPAAAVTAARLGFPEKLLAEQYYQLLKSGEITIDLSGIGQGSGVDGQVREWERPMPGKQGENAASKEEPMPGITSVEAQNIIERACERVLHQEKESQQRSDGRGTLPGRVLIHAKEILSKYQVDWRRALRRAIAAGIRRSGHDARDWSRVRQRNGTLAPRRKNQQLRIVVVCDTSGSMQGAAQNCALREIIKLSKEATQLDVVWCDVETKLQTNIKHSTKLKPIGGGGTDMRNGIREALDLKPDFLIVFTDGDTPWPDSAPRLNHLVVIVGQQNGPAGWRTENIQP